ncbi:MAG: type II secretion system protein [Candidatus Levybacteria bacterium]|nr:type II secretion system protein [Candidatus Levybacteria bacterium]
MEEQRQRSSKGFTQHHLLSGGQGSSLVPSKKRGAGFTLIELLVVISIIGFLASIALVNLNSARIKARVGSAKANLKSIQAGAVLCQDSDANLTFTGASACTGANTPVAAQVLCNGATTNAIGKWPTMPPGWGYSANCNSVYTAGTFRYGAAGDGCLITCTQTACVFSGCL